MILVPVLVPVLRYASLIGSGLGAGLASAAPAVGGDSGSTMLVAGFALAAASLVFFILELFIPTGGLLGLVCAVCVIASTAAFFVHDPLWGIAAFAVYCVLAPMGLLFGLRMWSHSPFAKRLILGAADDTDPSDEESMPRAELARRERAASLRSLVGMHGVAATSLRPIGFVVIGGRRVDALAEGNVIDAGAAVVVVDVIDNQIKVREQGAT